MMINGFMPRMSFLSSPRVTQGGAAPNDNAMPPPGLNPNNTLSSNVREFPSAGLPGWSASDLLNPLGNAMSSLSIAGSQLLSGLGAALSGLARMESLSMPNMSPLNSPFTQPPIFASAMPSIPAPRQPAFQSLSSGASQALKDVGAVLQKNAPAALAFGGAMMGGGAVCAFMGGAMAATGGILMGNQMTQLPTNHPA